MNVIVLLFLFVATTIAAPIISGFNGKQLGFDELGDIASAIIYWGGYGLILKTALKIGLLVCPFDPNYCLFPPMRLDQSTAKFNTLTDFNSEEFAVARSNFLKLHYHNFEQPEGHTKNLFAFLPVSTLVEHVENPNGQTRSYPIVAIVVENSYDNVRFSVGMPDTEVLRHRNAVQNLKEFSAQFGELSFKGNLFRYVKPPALHTTIPGTFPA